MIILHWLVLLLRDWIKTIKKKDFLRDLKILKKIKTAIIMTKVSEAMLEVNRVFILPHQVVLEMNQVKKHQLVIINLKGVFVFLM